MKRGHAYYATKYVYDHSPGRSWRRLNGALYETLKAAITAHLSFGHDDFRAIYSDMSGGYWMGNSVGSCCGEALYVHAVDVGHTPACISFENYAGRPAALWAENVKTPQRLCIGSEFTWERLRVTNMKADHLLACSYKYRESSGDDVLIAGNVRWLDKYRPIKWVKRYEDGGIAIRFGSAIGDHLDRKPERIFKIKYEELAGRRKAHDAERKKAISDVNAALSAKQLDAAIERLTIASRGNSFRPCDVEQIKGAIAAQRDKLKGAA